ncbi:uncharacterized protein TNCV_2395971 [Trichonephila clavipes]|uniref:Retrotransposon gag domain-containing protein n=1 Tax=Trichonephila clavipes TaxID=2585209 RepID=A0A8X6VQU2_TRICX|nr:uncharacterized protein TNCV_2395971 [Trichonephila clavipes]
MSRCARWSKEHATLAQASVMSLLRSSNACVDGSPIPAASGSVFHLWQWYLCKPVTAFGLKGSFWSSEAFGGDNRKPTFPHFRNRQVSHGLQELINSISDGRELGCIIALNDSSFHAVFHSVGSILWRVFGRFSASGFLRNKRRWRVNLSVQGGFQGDFYSGTHCNSIPEFRVGSNFRVILEQIFSGLENVSDFLENFDNNLTYYEIPTQLSYAYLKGHLTGRALDWFDVLGYNVVEEKATDYEHLKQALTEQFPVVRNKSELETRFYASYQNSKQTPSEFVYELLKIHKHLKLDMVEEKLLDHVISRLELQFLDYVEENWWDNRVNNRYYDNSRPQRESNRFGGQGVGDNRIFDSRRRSGQSDNRFNNHGGQQIGSRNGAFRGQNGQNRITLADLPYVPILLNETFITALWDTGAEKSFISEEVYRRYFSYRSRQKTKDRVVTAQGAPLSLRSG